MDRRQPQDIRVPLYNNGIGPGAARVVHYRMTVPKDARGTVDAFGGHALPQVHPRLHDVLAGRGHPSLPVTTLASDAVALRSPGAAALRPTSRTRGNPDPLWLRWNDYGIGLFLQGDLKGAARAWTKVDGARSGQARRAPQPRAGRDRGRPPRRRQGLARGGRAEAAGLGQDGLLPRHRRQGRGPPRGRRARPEGGPREVPARSRRLEQPRPHLLARGQVPRGDRGLRQDARDRPGGPERPLQPDARVSGDRAITKNAELHDAAYRKYKEDESIRAIPGEFRLENPWANRESLPIHVHAEAVPPPASAADWVASIGPKGYETDNGYLTRAHPPVPSEQDQWSYVTTRKGVAPPAAPRVSSAP